MQVSQRTWREAARFPESGVLPLSLTTQHEEVMGRIASCMAAAIVQTGRNVRFSASLPMLYNVGPGKDCAGKFLMIDTINLDMNDPGKRKTRPDSTEFPLFFCNLGFSAT